MIRFSKFVAIAAMATATAATAGAQGVVSATKPFSLGVSGGASIPTGDLSNAVNTGYNVTGHVTLGSPEIPLQFRGDVGYNSWGVKSPFTGNMHTWNFTGNAVYNVASGASQVRPYLLGGIGAYKFGNDNSSGSFTSSDTNFGFDLGGGIVIPLSGFNTFIEAKYTQVNGKNGNPSTKFVPISVGIMF